MICKHCADLMYEVLKEFYNNTLWNYIDGRYRESKHFKKAVMDLVTNICELNPMNKVGNVIPEFLKNPSLRNQITDKACTNKYATEYFPYFGKTTGPSNGKNKKINVPGQRTGKSRAPR